MTPEPNTLTRAQALSFFIRAAGLRTLRLIKDGRTALTVLPCRPEPLPFIAAESASPLRTAENPAERVFEEGKIANLRRACARIDGALLAPGHTFSFWKQIGPPWKSRGYAIGRELRQGCVVPAVGGGLCQLSGALFEAAVKTS